VTTIDRGFAMLRAAAGSGQVLVSILVVLLLGGAALAADKASGNWGAATANEIRWSAAALEDLRSVYTEEAPEAFYAAFEQHRADLMANFGAGDSALLDAEAATATRTAQDFVFALGDTNPLVADEYALPGGGYDVARRLGDVRQATSARIGLDVPQLLARGDQWSRVVSGLVWGCVVLVLLWVAAQAAAHLSRRGRGLGRAGATTHAPRSSEDQDPDPEQDPDRDPDASQELDLDLIPEPWLEQPRDRVLATAGLVAWIVLTLLPAITLTMSSEAARAGADSSRYAVAVSTDISASNVQSTHSLRSFNEQVYLATAGISRQWVALDLSDSEQQLLGQAEEEVANSWPAVSAPMTRLPSGDDGVDAELVQAMSTSPEDWGALGARQGLAADKAEQVGRAVTLDTLAIAFAGLAASALAFALAAPRAPKLVARGGLAMVGLAVLAALAGFVTFAG
jgi:hypothetical protein